MKGFLRRLMALGALGGACLGVTAAYPQAALALSEEEIIQKLFFVPVFMIVDGEGQSLTASVESDDGDEVTAPIVFVSGNSAEGFLAEATTEGAPFAADGGVELQLLGPLYFNAQAQDQSLAYIPTAQSVAAASSIASGTDIAGVPLFAAVNLQNGQYLLTSEQILPVYFSFADLQRNLAPLVEQNPDLQSIIGVEVLTLEGLLEGMESNNAELDQLLELVRLIPDSAAVPEAYRAQYQELVQCYTAEVPAANCPNAAPQ